MIIKPKPLHVQAEERVEPPKQPTTITIPPAVVKAGTESVEEEDDVLATSLAGGKMLLADDLKKYVSFRALMEDDDHQLRPSGKYVKCRCPFHSDETPSFCIYEDDAHAKCFGCGWYGNVIKYEMDFHDIEFKKAWWQLNDFLRNYPRAGRKAKPAARSTIPLEPQFTAKQLEERKKYAHRLASDTWIAEELCRRRHEKNGEAWNPAVLQQLAKESSLGWAGDAIAFIYPTGTKYRQWPTGEIIWECHSLSLWREHRLKEATHVYLTESETDAIALLHTGVEQKKPGHVVIAAPSATTFKEEWAPLFQDKVVVICYDNDGAGEKGVERVAALLAPSAKDVRSLNWKEVA